MNTRKKLLIFSWGPWILVFFAFSAFVQFYPAEISAPFYPAPLQQKTVIFFVGDVMLDRGVEWQVSKNGQGDWKFPFLKIEDYLKKADILFGNLESVISDKGVKVGSIYSFRADPRSINSLKYAGFDVVSVANNHIFDYSLEAMEDSFARLKEAGIGYAGGGFNEAEARAPFIKEVNSTKFAFLAYTNLGSKYWLASENKSGIAGFREDILKEDIGKAKKMADIVVVSFHFGDEYKTESNKEQKYFGRLSIDYGADLVVGHHPHVVQETEQYKEGYIAYSLGNFLFDQGFSKETMKGMLLRVEVQNKKITKIIPVKIAINDFFQPEIVKDGEN